MILTTSEFQRLSKNTERQLRDVVCDRIYEEEKSAQRDTNRPQLQAMLL